MADDAAERTEPATERRKQKAREQGKFAESRDLTAAAILFAAIVGFHVFGFGMAWNSAEIVRQGMSPTQIAIRPGSLSGGDVAKLGMLALVGVLPWLILVFLAALVMGLLKTGGFFIASERKWIDFNRVNPIEGFKRLFSLNNLHRTGIDLLKVAAVAGVACMVLGVDILPVTGFSGYAPASSAGYAAERGVHLGYMISAVLLIVGLIDLFYQRHRFEKDLRMSKEEVKQEAKDIDGDPAIRMARRRIQMKMARERMMKEVPQADVVVTNPTEIAVAIRYDENQHDAPVVVAAGSGFVAQKIREIAAIHGIPVVPNIPLARRLFERVNLNAPIPEEAFQAVATILAHVYRLKKPG